MEQVRVRHFLSLEPREPELRLLHNCFDAWRGIGDIVAGIARQENVLELRRYNGQGWRASPREAVQRAAGEALHRREVPGTAPRDWTATDESPR